MLRNINVAKYRSTQDEFKKSKQEGASRVSLFQLFIEQIPKR